MEHKLLARYPLGNPRRAWRQDNFTLHMSGPAPIDTKLRKRSALTQQKTRRAVKTAIDAGFTMMGTLWTDFESAMHVVRAAEQYGASVMLQDLRRFGGTGNPQFYTFYEKSDFEGAVRELKKWKCVKGFFIWDEPILTEQFEEARRMIEYLERECPEMLPFTVANPDYHSMIEGDQKAYAAYIERYINTIDPAQMDFDYYPIGKPEYTPAVQVDNSTMWSNLEIVRRAANNHEIPMWFAYQGHHYPWHQVEYTYKHEMTRCMAHAGVLYGAKAVEYYAEFAGFIDPATGGKGIHFEEQRRLNAELAALGNTLMALSCERVIHDDTLLADHAEARAYCTPMSESELLTGKLPTRISVSEHTDAYGNKYLMVLNRDWDTARHIQLNLKTPSHVYEISREHGEQVLQYEDTDYFWLNIAPGDLLLFRIQPATETPFTVEYYLDK